MKTIATGLSGVALALMLAVGPASAEVPTGDARRFQEPPLRKMGNPRPPRHDCKVQGLRGRTVVLTCEKTDGLRAGERVGIIPRPLKNGAPPPPPRPGVKR